MKKTKGFTLIELLIVVVILGILAVFVFLTLGGALNKPKDSKAKTSITEVRKALEQFMVATDGTAANTAMNTTGWRAMNATDLQTLKDNGVMSFNELPKDASGITAIQISVNNAGLGATIGQYAVRAKSTTSGKCWWANQKDISGLTTLSTACY